MTSIAQHRCRHLKVAKPSCQAVCGAGLQEVQVCEHRAETEDVNGRGLGQLIHTATPSKQQ